MLFCFTFSETECENIAVVACSQDFLLILGILFYFILFITVEIDLLENCFALL